jgi:phytol kinase
MNILGLLLSFILVILVVGLGFFLSRQEDVSSETVRKIIHIGVSNWWFILIAFFDALSFALIGPILFVITNGVAVLSGFADRLGVSDRGRNFGLIYFPISLFIAVLLGYSHTIELFACGIGIITMGYGDGLAALIGKRWGKRILFGHKTVAGTVTMFLVTLLVVCGFSYGYAIPMLWSPLWWISAVGIALGASLFEAYTPKGLDNLSVPIGTMLLAHVLLGSV